MKIIQKIIDYNLPCKLGFHKYIKYTETKHCTGVLDGTLEIPIRECTKCGKIEHHLMPMANGSLTNWKPYKFKNINVIETRRIR